MKYTIFNLTIDSSIPLPLSRHAADASRADILFREGAVPGRIAAPRAEGRSYQIGDREFLLVIRNVARFWGHEGRSVFIERTGSASDKDIALFLIGTVLGLLLHQRKIFLLHASAVVREGGAILISGRSGAGKSTLSAAMVREGCRLIADDICMLTLQGGRAVVHPGHSHIKLWRDSLNLFDISAAQLPRVHDEMEKHYWPVGDSFETRPQPVCAFFELASGEEPETVITRLTGVDKILALARNTFRVEILDNLSHADSVVYWAARARHFQLFRMTHSGGQTASDGVQSRVEAIMRALKENSL